MSVSVWFSSVTQSCPTLCDPMNHSMPGLPVHHQLLEFTQTHVHRVSDAIQPSHSLSSPSPPAPNTSLPASESFPMSQLLQHHSSKASILRHSVLFCCFCCCQVASVVSDSVRPHRWQPTKLLHPWDFPGKSTGVGCHCLLQQFCYQQSNSI